MVKILNASCENEIHRVHSPFNEDFQKYNFFGQGGTNYGGNLEKMAKNRETYCYAN